MSLQTRHTCPGRAPVFKARQARPVLRVFLQSSVGDTPAGHPGCPRTRWPAGGLLVWETASRPGPGGQRTAGLSVTHRESPVFFLKWLAARLCPWSPGASPGQWPCGGGQPPPHSQHSSSICVALPQVRGQETLMATAVGAGAWEVILVHREETRGQHCRRATVVAGRQADTRHVLCSVSHHESSEAAEGWTRARRREQVRNTQEVQLAQCWWPAGRGRCQSGTGRRRRWGFRSSASEVRAWLGPQGGAAPLQSPEVPRPRVKHSHHLHLTGESRRAGGWPVTRSMSQQ